jgi:hypothetical protein
VKLLFTPISIGFGLVAGAAAKRVFDAIWAMFDEEEAPSPKHRDVPLGKMLAALVVQGAIFRAVRGLADHQLRRGFAAVTGSWPGEKRPDPE